VRYEYVSQQTDHNYKNSNEIFWNGYKSGCKKAMQTEKLKKKKGIE